MIPVNTKKLFNHFTIVGIFLSTFSCGGIGIIKHTDIDKTKFIEEIEFSNLPLPVQDVYYIRSPASARGGDYPLRSSESMILVKDNEELDTVDVLTVHREFMFGLGSWPSQNNKGNILKSGTHFKYKGRKFYLKYVGSGQPLIIMDDILYLYDSDKNNHRYPYDMKKYPRSTDKTIIVNMISLKKWLKRRDY